MYIFFKTNVKERLSNIVSNHLKESINKKRRNATKQGFQRFNLVLI